MPLASSALAHVANHRPTDSTSLCQRSILEIALDLQRLQTAASAGKLGVSDLQGGTFSISNIGNLGGTYCGPIINVPEVRPFTTLYPRAPTLRRSCTL